MCRSQRIAAYRSPSNTANYALSFVMKDGIHSQLTRQLDVRGLNVNGKRFLDQLNCDNECQIVPILLHTSFNSPKRTTCNANCVARARKRAGNKRCTLGPNAESVNLVIVEW